MLHYKGIQMPDHHDYSESVLREGRVLSQGEWCEPLSPREALLARHRERAAA